MRPGGFGAESRNPIKRIRRNGASAGRPRYRNISLMTSRPSSLHIVPLGALVAGLTAGVVETWLHVATLPETAPHLLPMAATAALTDHGIALLLGVAAWLAVLPFTRSRPDSRSALILAAQSVGLLTLGIAYWYNDVKLSAPLFAPRSLKADAVIIVAGAAIWAIAAALLARLGAAKLRPRASLTAYCGGVLLLAAAAWGTPRCTGEWGAGVGPGPNLVLISLDTQRADHLPVYGYPRDTAPHITRLARAGICFTNAFSPAPSSAPGHAAMLTGLHPLTCGVTMNGQRLPEDAVTLAEHLAERGYRTAGLVQNPWLTTALGFSQGFQTFYNDRRLERAARTWPRLGLFNTMLVRIRDRLDPSFDSVTPLAADWMAEGGPFFLFYHLIDPHQPYDPSRGGRGRFRDPDYAGPVRDTQRAADRFASDPSSLRPADLDHLEDRYDESIYSADAKIGRLLEAIEGLGIAQQTLVVLTADHGENLKRHARHFDHEDLHAATLHIPWILYWPGRIEPRRVDAPVELPDLVPTVCALLETAPPESARGRRVDLEAASEAPLVSIDRTGKEERRALRLPSWNLIRRTESESVELFDLRADPHELVDVAGRNPELVQRFATLLDSLAGVLELGALESELGIDALDEAAKRRLQALGYL